MAANKIALISHGRYEEAPASAALKPGHLIELLSTGKVAKHATPGGLAERMFALEHQLEGYPVNLMDAYAADDPVQITLAYPGDVIQARLAAAAVAVVVGDVLESAGDGTLRKVEPLAGYRYVQTAESAEHENTVTAADFDKSYTIPANTLRVGDVIRVRAQVKVVDNNSTDTLTLLLTLGGETLATTGAVDVADGDVGFFDATIVVRAIGATGEIQATGLQALGVPGTVTAKPFFVNDATVDTTAGLKVAVNADWSVAHADNEASLSLLTVEIIRGNPVNGGAIAKAIEAVDNSAGIDEAFVAVRVL
jgi:hypothetical protein